MNSLHNQPCTSTRRDPANPERRFHVGKLFALVVAGSTALSASAFEAQGDGVYRDRIDIGTMMDMSGPAAGTQVVWTTGFQDYMRRLNETGNIHGRKVNVLAEDSRFNPAQDKINYEKLVSQTPVLAIAGLGSSSSQAALATTIRAGKVPITGAFVVTKLLSEPPTPLVYGGFCGLKQMAQTGVGYYTEKLKLKAPKVITVSIESAGGVEYHEYVDTAVKKLGGTSSLVTMKANAADVTPQVLEIIKQKPDFITIYGVSNTPILTMKTMAQYGLNIPAFGITYLMSQQIYSSMGPQAGENYNVVSCFTPGGADQSPGNIELVAAADKYNRGAFKDDINYVAGWVAGQITTEALRMAGPEPTRAKLIESMSKGFTVDTKGLTAPIVYTPSDRIGPATSRMVSYDYAEKKFRLIGEYRDYAKYLK